LTNIITKEEKNINTNSTTILQNLQYYLKKRKEKNNNTWAIIMRSRGSNYNICIMVSIFVT